MKEEGEDVTGASFGIGAVPNWYVFFVGDCECFSSQAKQKSSTDVPDIYSFHPQINLEVLTTKMDWAKLHRSRDPGAGAFTPYHNRRSYAYRNIRAGYVCRSCYCFLHGHIFACALFVLIPFSLFVTFLSTIYTHLQHGGTYLTHCSLPP
jgi:hypothetical protein